MFVQNPLYLDIQLSMLDAESRHAITYLFVPPTRIPDYLTADGLRVTE